MSKSVLDWIFEQKPPHAAHNTEKKDAREDILVYLLRNLDLIYQNSG